MVQEHRYENINVVLFVALVLSALSNPLTNPIFVNFPLCLPVLSSSALIFRKFDTAAIFCTSGTPT